MAHVSDHIPRQNNHNARPSTAAPPPLPPPSSSPVPVSPPSPSPSLFRQPSASLSPSPSQQQQRQRSSPTPASASPSASASLTVTATFVAKQLRSALKLCPTDADLYSSLAALVNPLFYAHVYCTLPEDRAHNPHWLHSMRHFARDVHDHLQHRHHHLRRHRRRTRPSANDDDDIISSNSRAMLELHRRALAQHQYLDRIGLFNAFAPSLPCATVICNIVKSLGFRYQSGKFVCMLSSSSSSSMSPINARNINNSSNNPDTQNQQQNTPTVAFNVNAEHHHRQCLAQAALLLTSIQTLYTCLEYLLTCKPGDACLQSAVDKAVALHKLRDSSGEDDIDDDGNIAGVANGIGTHLAYNGSGGGDLHVSDKEVIDGDSRHPLASSRSSQMDWQRLGNIFKARRTFFRHLDQQKGMLAIPSAQITALKTFITALLDAPFIARDDLANAFPNQTVLALPPTITAVARTFTLADTSMRRLWSCQVSVKLFHLSSARHASLFVRFCDAVLRLRAHQHPSLVTFYAAHWPFTSSSSSSSTPSPSPSMSPAAFAKCMAAASGGGGTAAGPGISSGGSCSGMSTGLLVQQYQQQQHHHHQQQHYTAMIVTEHLSTHLEAAYTHRALASLQTRADVLLHIVSAVVSLHASGLRHGNISLRSVLLRLSADSGNSNSGAGGCLIGRAKLDIPNWFDTIFNLPSVHVMSLSQLVFQPPEVTHLSGMSSSAASSSIAAASASIDYLTSDVWSLGVLACFLLAIPATVHGLDDAHAFTLKWDQVVRAYVRYDPHAMARQCLQLVRDQRIAAAIARCFVPDPARRITSFQFQQSLAPILSQLAQPSSINVSPAAHRATLPVSAKQHQPQQNKQHQPSPPQSRQQSSVRRPSTRPRMPANVNTSGFSAKPDPGLNANAAAAATSARASCPSNAGGENVDPCQPDGIPSVPHANGEQLVAAVNSAQLKRIAAIKRAMRSSAMVVDLVPSSSDSPAAAAVSSGGGSGNGSSNSVGAADNGNHIHMPSTHVQLDENDSAGLNASFKTHLMSIAVRGTKRVAEQVETAARLPKRGRQQQQQQQQVMATDNEDAIVTSRVQQRQHKQQCQDNGQIRQLTGPGPNLRAAHQFVRPSQVHEQQTQAQTQAVPVGTEMVTPHAKTMTAVKQEAIIALDNSNSDYGFGYEDEHDDNMPVDFNFTAYDPLAEERQQLPPEPEPEPEPQSQLTVPQPQLTVPQPQLTVPQPQIAPQADKRMKQTAFVEHKDSFIDRKSDDPGSIARKNGCDASGNGTASGDGGDCKTNHISVNGNNNVVSWKGRVRTRTRKASSSYADLDSDDVDDEGDNNLDLNDEDCLHIDNSISVDNVLEGDNIADVSAPNSSTQTPLLTVPIILRTSQRSDIVSTPKDVKGNNNSSRRSSTGIAAGTPEATTSNKIPKRRRRKRSSTTPATPIPTPTQTPGSTTNDPMQVVIDPNPPMSTATESKDAIISGPNTGPGHENLVVGVMFEEGPPEMCNMNMAVRHYELAVQQGNIKAKSRLAKCCYKGIGMPANVTRAAALYCQLADQHGIDLVQAAHCCSKGIGMPVDVRRALKLYTSAANGGDVEGMVEAGKLMLAIENGTVDVDDEQGDAADFDISLTQIVSFFEAAMKRGSVEAQVELAGCYAKGKGIRRNIQKAVELYRQAASQKDPSAILFLGLLHEDGNGVRKNCDLALKYYRQSAAMKHAPGQTALGQCYLWGYGVTADYAKARELFLAAAEQGHALALHELGMLYKEGHGVPKDMTTAVSYFATASSKGSEVSMVQLGECLYHGHGLECNFEKAFEYFSEAARRGASEGYRWLGDCYADGSGTQKQLKLAVDCYRKGADLGSAPALTSLGSCHEHGLGVGKNMAQAVKYYRQAATAGDHTAENNLGILYEAGRHVKKDFVKAVGHYRKAVQRGSVDAMCNLADCYAMGTGVTKSIEKAVEWYEKGAQHGLASAQTELGVCYYEGKGVAKDPVKAVQLFKQAARTNEPEALRNLAHALLDGRGIQADHAKAFKLLSDAAHDRSNGDACYDLARCYEMGLGTRSSASKAEELYAVAAKAGHLTASAALGNLLHNQGRFKEACQYHLQCHGAMPQDAPEQDKDRDGRDGVAKNGEESKSKKRSPSDVDPASSNTSTTNTTTNSCPRTRNKTTTARAVNGLQAPGVQAS